MASNGVLLCSTRTGVQYSVRDFVNIAAQELGMEIRWEGNGVDEVGYLDTKSSILNPRAQLCA